MPSISLHALPQANFIDKAAVEFGFVPVNYRIMTGDSHCPVIV